MVARTGSPDPSPGASHEGGNVSPPYPTLTFIDTLLADGAGEFRAAPDAPRLEPFARALLNRLWGDQAWTPGEVADPSLTEVVSAIEEYRNGVSPDEIARRFEKPVRAPTESGPGDGPHAADTSPS